jgi:DNA-binding NarL/FixJ family response regulator
VYDRRSRPLQHINFNYFIDDATPIPDQVAFRLDVPRFFETLSARQRAMAMDLASGMTTKEVARKHGVSAAAVSQFRSRFKVLLERFYEAA